MTRQDQLNVEGILSEGYGVIPKKIMKDKTISMEAKAIYAFLASYTGKGETSFPSVALITDSLGMTRQRYNRHRAVLEEKGYISVIRERKPDGTLGRNVYRINQVIPKEPTLHSPTLDGPTMDEPTLGGVTNNNNTFNNNTINNNSSNINNVQPEVEQESAPADWENDFNDWWQLYGKKVGKKKSKSLFKKYHKQDGYEAIKRGTVAYLKTITDKKFQKDPERFLKHELYNDVEGFEELAKQKAASGFSGRNYQHNPYADDGNTFDF